MVQYIFTPWRDHGELLGVRRQFYPDRTASPPPPAALDGPDRDDEARPLLDKQRAVSRVSMWMHRGNCPHLVESTALLTAALLMEQPPGGASTLTSSEAYAARAAYSAAFSRFVTGLLDSHQDKQRKMSMYAVAKSVGLPATFVELRHQATHEQLPSLAKLRSAARRALDWIWEYYWMHLPDPEATAAAPSDGGDPPVNRVLRTLLIRFLKEADEKRAEALRRELCQWGDADVLRALSRIGDSTQDTKLLRKSLEFSRQILRSSPTSSQTTELQQERDAPVRDVERIRAEILEGEKRLRCLADAISGREADQDQGVEDDRPGWSRYQGRWTPKPIGVV